SRNMSAEAQAPHDPGHAECLCFNGINGASGDYLLPAMTPQEVAALARGEELDKAHRGELERRHQRDTEAHLGPIEGVDPRDLAQTGWGVLFAHDADPGIRDGLKELLDHRREQAGR